MSMLLIGSVLGAVVMVAACAIWLLLRHRGSGQEAPQLEAHVEPVSADVAKPPSRNQKVSAHHAHLNSAGEPLKPKRYGELSACIDDDEVELDAGLSFEASRVQQKARYFDQAQHPSFYALNLDGHRLEVEVRFWGDSVNDIKHQAYVELQLRVPDGQDHQPLLEYICQWLGEELKMELPCERTVNERGVVICELSGKYFGLVSWQSRTLELFSWELGASSIEPLWFGIDHEQGRGWFWVSAEHRVRLKLAHHLSIHLRGGRPYRSRAQAQLPGFVDEPLVRELLPLAVEHADELFIRGQRVALVQEHDQGDGFSVMILDHVSDRNARELLSCVGGFASLDFDEAGQVLILSRFNLGDDALDETIFEAFSLSSGELLWRLVSHDEEDGFGYRACVSPVGDRVVLAKHIGGDDDSSTQLVLYDALTGQELERSTPQELQSLERWLDVGIMCALEDDEDQARVCQGIWSPATGIWRVLQHNEVSLPHVYELIRLHDDGIELLNGARWPYVQLNDLTLWPLLETLSLEVMPWVGAHHLLWSADDDTVLNVKDGSARPLFHDEDHDYFIVAYGDGVVVWKNFVEDRLYWATFSVSEVSASGGVLTGVAW